MQPDDPVALGSLTWQLIIIANSLLSLCAAVVAFRRRPPIAEELYRDFATKIDTCTELTNLRASISLLAQDTHASIGKLSGEVFSRINEVSAQSSQSFQDFQRCIGRLEGIIEQIKSP